MCASSLERPTTIEHCATTEVEIGTLPLRALPCRCDQKNRITLRSHIVAHEPDSARLHKLSACTVQLESALSKTLLLRLRFIHFELSVVGHSELERGGQAIVSFSNPRTCGHREKCVG